MPGCAHPEPQIHQDNIHLDPLDRLHRAIGGLDLPDDLDVVRALQDRTQSHPDNVLVISEQYTDRGQALLDAGRWGRCDSSRWPSSGALVRTTVLCPGADSSWTLAPILAARCRIVNRPMCPPWARPDTSPRAEETSNPRPSSTISISTRPAGMSSTTVTRTSDAAE